MVVRRKPVQDALTRKKQGVQNIDSRDQVTSSCTVSTSPVTKTSKRFEQVKLVLEAEGIHDFALMMADETGNARVHTFGQGKSLFNGATFAIRSGKPNDLPLRPSLHPMCENGHLLEIDNMDDQTTSFSSLSRRGRRVGRGPYRARTMLPEAELPLVISSAPTAANSVDRVGSQVHAASDADDHSYLATTQYHQTKSTWLSIMLNDVEATTAFYESRLKLMQQLPAKKIAKAWIKGICPKKQARFPYSAGKGKKQNHIPPFWPSTDECPFVEPDHIDRHQRTSLLIHFLRLRATPEQLKEWNEDTTEYNDTHVSQGWTAFLQKLAGPEIFDELPKGPPGRNERRQKYLDQIYELASMEEDVQNDRIDPTKRFFYEPDEDICSTSTPESIAAQSSKRSREQSEDSSAVPTSRSPSVSDCGTRKKFSRKSPTSNAEESAVVESLKPQAKEKKQRRRRKAAPSGVWGPPAISSTQVDSPRQAYNPAVPRPRQDNSPVSVSGSMPIKKESRAQPRKRASSRVPIVRAFNANMWNGNPLPSWLSHDAGHVHQPATLDLSTNLPRFPQRQDIALQQYSFDHGMTQSQQAGRTTHLEFYPMACEPQFLPNVPAVPELVGLPQYSSPEDQYAMSVAPAQVFGPGVMTQHMMDMQLGLSAPSWPVMYEQRLASPQMIQQYHDLSFEQQHQPWSMNEDCQKGHTRSGTGL